MTPRQFILVFCLIIFALLTSMTADAQTPAPPTPPRARIYLPLLYTVQRGAGEVLWADRYRLQPGECTQIHWALTSSPWGVYAVYLNDMPVTGQDTRWVCPLTTAQYVLRVVRSTGTDWYRVTITVGADNDPAIEFAADSYRVMQGQCTIIRWRVTEARAVYLDHQGVAAESVRAVCPATDTTYVLDVEFTDGTTATRRLTITVVPTDTLVMRFWAEQYTLPPGACTILHWNVQNAREVYLDDQPVVGMAVVAVCPSANYVYTLRAVDASGQSTERGITLWVGDPALVAWEVIAQGIVNGVAPMVDADPNQAGDQPGYRVVIDGINALYTGTAGWSQSAVTFMVQQADIPSDSEVGGIVDWPIHPGQQVEFRAFCSGANCSIHPYLRSYLLWRSE